VVDVTGLADGYVSDQTRTVFLGEPDARLVSAYETCRAILDACEQLLVPGTPAAALYERGLEVATEAGLDAHYMGFGRERMRFVGHAIGLELNEAPALARGVAMPLVAGAVIAVEPKLVFPGLGAVGVENSYVVRAAGPERLTLAGDDPIRLEP
jgi:Xaa-Pro aminopeptidase